MSTSAEYICDVPRQYYSYSIVCYSSPVSCLCSFFFTSSLHFRARCQLSQPPAREASARYFRIYFSQSAAHISNPATQIRCPVLSHQEDHLLQGNHRLQPTIPTNSSTSLRPPPDVSGSQQRLILMIVHLPIICTFTRLFFQLQANTAPGMINISTMPILPTASLASVRSVLVF